ncbi:hypothetical protein C0Q70_13990 [Pomacea canaliculata]|uniref:Amidase domain-containing protein n=1 Tax=Pomacea canaliculata TaxID=400727 RepID=A0A2T7NYS4_POMCA|nr:hypothetical protein C0Q70_13990 [Pomacea canaliculata]
MASDKILSDVDGGLLPTLSDLTTLSTKLGLQWTDEELAVLEDKTLYPIRAWRCDIHGAAEGKLAGRTVGIKDNIAVAGIPMSVGTAMLREYLPDFDATVVTRILDAGGRIMGKTTTEAMCLSGSSVTSCDGPVTNPWDVARIAGGSSSGSAALVAGGIVDMALGGDQGGSVRIPASCTGIVGMKPTFGLIPYTGAMAIDTSLDHIGVMATSVRDCALLLEVTAGYDKGRDTRQKVLATVPQFSTLLEASLYGRKAALLKEGFDNCEEEDVKDLVEKVAAQLHHVGVSVTEASVPLHQESAGMYTATCLQGAYYTMLKGGGAGYCDGGYHPVSLQEAMFRGLNSDLEKLPTVVKRYLIFGEFLERSIGPSLRGKGRNLILALADAYDSLLQEVDVLIMPTLPRKAAKIPPPGTPLQDIYRHTNSWSANTRSFNLTGHPAISVPVGRCVGPVTTRSCNMGDDQLPVGLMVVGRRYEDLTVLQVAHALEKLNRELNDSAMAASATR